MHQNDTSETGPEPEGRGDAPPRRLHSKNGMPLAPLPYRGKGDPPTAGAVNGVVSKRITVGTESAIGPPASASLVEAEELPGVVRELEAGRKLIVPSGAELELALSQANTLEDLIGFEKMVSVLKKAGEQFRVVRDEAIRIASIDLITARKIGVVLLQVMKHGGDRSSGHRDHLLAKLLADLGESKVKRCKQIARIEGSIFASYLEEMASVHAVPTEAGALRRANKVAKAAGKASEKARRAPTSMSAAAGDAVLSPAMLDCVQRSLGPIDVCIGDARVKCEVRLGASTAKDKDIHGRVFVGHCIEPSQCLTKLAGLKRAGAIEEAIVVLPRDIDATWWPSLSAGQWSICVPSERGSPIVAHIGGHARGFALVFAALGVVADVQQRLGAEAGGE